MQIILDLKAHGNYGRPGPGTTVEDWKKYIQAYKKEYNADIILIDGRFRVACALDIFSKIRKDILAEFIKKPNIGEIPSDVYNKYL